MTYDNITLRLWKEIKKVFETEYEDDILRSAELIKIVFGIENPLRLSPNEFAEKVEELKFLGEDIKEKKLLVKYNIRGTNYLFHGNVFQINMSQLIDWRAYSTKEDVDYAECLSVFLIPEGHKYNDGYDMEKTIDDLNELSLPYALKLYSFFVDSLRCSIRIMTDYFNKLLKKTKTDSEIKIEIRKNQKMLQDLTDTIFSHT